MVWFKYWYCIVKVKLLSCVQLFATPWTAAHQAPPSMGFSRQEYWSGLPFPSPGDLPNPGIELRSPALQADALTSEPQSLKKMKVLVTQRLTFCDPMDCSSPGSSIHGILQAGIVNWVAIPFSRGSSQPRDQTPVSCITGRFFTVGATREAPVKFLSENFF